MCSLRVFWMILRGGPAQRRHPFSMRTPPLRAGPNIQGPATQSTATMGAATTTSSKICRSSKGSQIVCLRLRRRVWWGGLGGAAPFLTRQKFWCYDHTPQHLHRDAPPYTVPKGTLIVNCLIRVTHNHEAGDGSHFLFVPSSRSGFLDAWVERAVPLKRGSASFVFDALDVHRGSGIPKASPTSVPSSPHGIFCNRANPRP